MSRSIVCLSLDGIHESLKVEEKLLRESVYPLVLVVCFEEKMLLWQPRARNQMLRLQPRTKSIILSCQGYPLLDPLACLGMRSQYVLRVHQRQTSWEYLESSVINRVFLTERSIAHVKSSFKYEIARMLMTFGGFFTLDRCFKKLNCILFAYVDWGIS